MLTLTGKLKKTISVDEKFVEILKNLYCKELIVKKSQ